MKRSLEENNSKKVEEFLATFKTVINTTLLHYAAPAAM